MSHDLTGATAATINGWEFIENSPEVTGLGLETGTLDDRSKISYTATFDDLSPVAIKVDMASATSEIRFYLDPTIVNNSGIDWNTFRTSLVSENYPATQAGDLQVHPVFSHFHDANIPGWTSPSGMNFTTFLGMNTGKASLTNNTSFGGINGADELWTYSGSVDDGTTQNWQNIGIHQFQEVDVGGGSIQGGDFYIVLEPNFWPVHDRIMPTAQVVYEDFSFSNSHGGTERNDLVFGYNGADDLTGNGGDDILAGGVENDTLSGNDGADWLFGGADDDLLIGGAGNDVFDGGAGSDTAIYASARLANTITLVAGGADTVSGTFGVDRIERTERLVFTDGEFVTGTGDEAAQVYRLYGATLDREPDPGGLKGWTEALRDHSVTLEQEVNGFIGSPEFQARYGNLNDSDFVSQLYRNVLDREPDGAEVQGWVDAIGTGTTRAQVVLGFSESAEYIEKTRPAVEEGLWLRDDDAASVARLYSATLDRLPDQDGLASWTDAIKTGTSLQQVADGFVGSAEFQGRYGNLGDAAFVELLYDNVLDRAPDPEGLSAWTDALASGMTRSEVVTGFSESLEYIGIRAPFTDQGVWLAEG